MLIGIRRRAPDGASEERGDDVAGLLIACHGRIRGFLDVAARLAAARGEPDASIADAAARLGRYFGEALPLHALDEDVSIAPRLIDADPGDELRDALGLMGREHVETEEVLAELSPLWAAVSRDPPELDAHRAALGAGAERLREIFRDHLDREERLVFPAVSRLPAEIQALIAAEMRARRQPR